MPDEVKVIFLGLGEMGRRIAQFALKKEGLRAVGAVDIAKDIAGRDLGDVIGTGKIHVRVDESLDDLLSRVRADIVVQATFSDLARAVPQISRCLKAKVSVVSTCEELSYPYYKHPEISAELDRLAKANGVAVLGTGINPGFLMDTLPITLSGVCHEVKRIRVTRIMDSSRRRIPFQKKVGEGLSREEFRRMIDQKLITGHVGLVESTAMIAGALGWEVDEIRELPPEPIIAQRELTTSYAVIKPGQVAGLKSVAYAGKGGEKVITLEFLAYAGAEEEYDLVEIEGVPSIHEKIAGGVHGDIGTSAVIVNMIPKVLNSPPGLVTMKDLPPVSAIVGDIRGLVRPVRIG